MRIVFGALSLLVVVVIVAVLAKKELGAVAPAPAATQQGVAMPTGTPQQQVQRVQQSVEDALKQARPVDDDTK